MKKYLTKGVWMLSLISMFTDIASEMLYPVMPIYLQHIGFSIVLIGILEGVAEATAGLSKGYFGKVSDLAQRRVPFIQIGYALSAISKPLMAMFTWPLWVFFARTIDRLGKGIRTGARDALLSDEATPATKGKVFGFHRSMDTLGAVFGPLLALVYLYFFPADYTRLFFLAFIPGLLAIGIALLLKDKKHDVAPPFRLPSFWAMFGYVKESPLPYRKVVAGLLVFTLFNSSDLFLLLKAKQSGMSDTATVGLYILYNCSYAFLSYPLGALADKIGLKTVFIGGLMLFALVYAGMAVTDSIGVYLLLFFLYGLYAAATEGISKAWISNISDKKDTATAIGTYAGLQSICTMLASALAGLIWYRFGSATTFGVTAAVTVMVIVYFSFFIEERNV
jgi:MFS family permease